MGTGKEGGQAPPTGHELDGADGVLIVIAAQPVGGVVFLREVLEDLHEGQREDACGPPDGALRRKERAALSAQREVGPPRPRMPILSSRPGKAGEVWAP